MLKLIISKDFLFFYSEIILHYLVFGLNIILNVFGINNIPGLNLNSNSSSAFIQEIILTLSNPITIVFWGSVLTTKIIEEKFKKKELAIFSAGLVSATLFFLIAYTMKI